MVAGSKCDTKLDSSEICRASDTNDDMRISVYNRRSFEPMFILYLLPFCFFFRVCARALRVHVRIEQKNCVTGDENKNHIILVSSMWRIYLDIGTKTAKNLANVENVAVRRFNCCYWNGIRDEPNSRRAAKRRAANFLWIEKPNNAIESMHSVCCWSVGYVVSRLGVRYVINTWWGNPLYALYRRCGDGATALLNHSVIIVLVLLFFIWI